MTDSQFDVVFIGGGPGGYTGAIRAAQLGLKTAVVEKEKTLGGTCLNVGCIPSKALLDSSEHYSEAMHSFANHGIKVSNLELDLPAMLARKSKIVGDLTNGIQFLFKKNKIEWIKGTGKVKAANQVEVIHGDGQITNLYTKYIVLAAGSVPVELPGFKFDGKQIISSTEALSLPQVPKHLLVIGAGAIGLEMGSVWSRLGAKVTVVEFAENIAGATDIQLSKQLLKILSKQGMTFLVQTKVVKADVSKKGVQVHYESLVDGSKGSLDADVVLVAAGRRAFPDLLGLDQVGVKSDNRGRVLIDAHFCTNVKSIFAIGDLVAGPMLAHKAEEEGVAVAELIAGKAGHVNYETVPSVIYTWPEVAMVGLTEEAAKAKGIDFKTGSFPFVANGRAKALGCTDGLVKIIADAETDRVLGVHILGPRASDMIAEAVVAMEFAASSEDLARSFHAHPTLSEVMREAALSVDKRARQM